MKFLVLSLSVSLLIVATVAIDFASSDESCDDSSSSDDSGEHGGGGGNNGGGNNGGGTNPPRGNGSCESGWTRVERPSGPWCIRVFAGENSRGTADERCRLLHARLSGIQSHSEANLMTRTALSVIPGASFSIWVGAQRKSICRKVALTDTCTRTNSFGWTDKSTTGTAGFALWNTKQPDNIGKAQKCVVLLASRSTTTITDSKATWHANRLDDVVCAVPGGSPARTVKGFVCGKKP